MKAVYKLHFDCGRMGTLHGIFVEEKEKVETLAKSGKEIYFGEVLGKHSEITGPLSEEDYTMISDDPTVVGIVENYGLTCGFNPVEYAESE